MAGPKEVKLPFPVMDISTPSFLVDLNKVKKNASSMLERTAKMGVKLRPHMKTAKTLEAGVLLTGGTKKRITVSTLAEAEFFAAGGFDDILFAMLFAANKIPRLQALNQRLSTFHLAVDSTFGCDLLEANPPKDGEQWSVFLLVDTGYGRDGSSWDAHRTIDLAMQLSISEHINFRGLYTHEGVSYDQRGEEALRSCLKETISRLLHVKNKLKEENIVCEEVTYGATPTSGVQDVDVKEITEIHPGNYVFYDTMQHMIGSCHEEDIACRVATRVLGNYPDRQRLLLDIGWTAISKDGPLPNGSYGTFQGYPHLKLVGMSQEYGYAEYDKGHYKGEDFPQGTMLFFYPYHACATSMCHQTHFVHEGDLVTATWKPCSQW